MKKKLLLGFILGLLGSYAQAQVVPPAQRPTDFTLALKYDGGMSYFFSELYISTDSCYYRKNDRGKQTEKRFKLSASQLDEIYAVVLKNELAKIETKTEKGAVYDRGGTSLTLTWNQGEQVLGVSDAYSTFIKDEWKEKWSAFQTDLAKVLKKKLKSYK